MQSDFKIDWRKTLKVVLIHFCDFKEAWGIISKLLLQYLESNFPLIFIDFCDFTVTSKLIANVIHEFQDNYKAITY